MTMDFSKQFGGVPRDALALANTLYDRLQTQLTTAQDALDADHYLQVDYFTESGECISVNSLGYHNPHLIMLYGVDGRGRECTILVHMDALKLILRVNEIQKARPQIGFRGSDPEGVGESEQPGSA